MNEKWLFSLESGKRGSEKAKIILTLLMDNPLALLKCLNYIGETLFENSHFSHTNFIFNWYTTLTLVNKPGEWISRYLFGFETRFTTHFGPHGHSKKMYAFLSYFPTVFTKNICAKRRKRFLNNHPLGWKWTKNLGEENFRLKTYFGSKKITSRLKLHIEDSTLPWNICHIEGSRPIDPILFFTNNHV